MQVGVKFCKGLIKRLMVSLSGSCFVVYIYFFTVDRNLDITKGEGTGEHWFVMRRFRYIEVLFHIFSYYYMAMSQKDWKQTNSSERSCCNSCPQKVTNKKYEKISLFLLKISLFLLNGRLSGPSRGSR